MTKLLNQLNTMRPENLQGFCLLAALCVLALTVLAMRADSRLLHRRLRAEAAAKRQWSRVLADSVFDGLLIHRQGLILQMNRALARMLGTREREWLGQHFANLARPDQSGALRAELEAPQPQIAEFRLLRANKSEVTVELSSQNIEFEGLPATVTAIRDISQRVVDARRIARLTHYDSLTGLPNRKLFCEMLATALARAERKSGAVTMFTLDLDRFKAMNAEFGRENGDALLEQAARRIAACATRDDLLARIGGDKFALLLAGGDAANRAMSLGGQLAAAFNEPFIVDGQLAKLSVSIGIAMYPDHAADAAALLNASGFALAQAARKGGGAVHMFCHHEASRPG